MDENYLLDLAEEHLRRYRGEKPESNQPKPPCKKEPAAPVKNGPYIISDDGLPFRHPVGTRVKFIRRNCLETGWIGTVRSIRDNGLSGLVQFPGYQIWCDNDEVDKENE